jgi:hypothetical protein
MQKENKKIQKVGFQNTLKAHTLKALGNHQSAVLHCSMGFSLRQESPPAINNNCRAKKTQIDIQN